MLQGHSISQTVPNGKLNDPSLHFASKRLQSAARMFNMRLLNFKLDFPPANPNKKLSYAWSMPETSGISIPRNRIKTGFCWTMEEMCSQAEAIKKVIVQLNAQARSLIRH
jgi:hypothetical protein